MNTAFDAPAARALPPGPVLGGRLADATAHAAAQLSAVQHEIDAARKLLARARESLRHCLGAIVPPGDVAGRRLLDDAIVSLQSEDIVDQLMDHARHRVAGLSELLVALAPAAVGEGGHDLADRLDVVNRSLDALARKRHPVTLHPTAGDGIELF